MAKAKKKGKGDERQVNVAVIGAGSMANRVHYPSLTSFPDVNLVAMCDLDPVRLEATADAFGVARRYSDYRRMIEDTDPDAVYAIGQPHHMYDVWHWCLEQGRNLYIEKPPGLTLHQTRSLAYLADKHDCITQVSFQRRASPLFNLLRDRCLKRGPMVQAVCTFYKNAIQPMTGVVDRMLDDGVHVIDTLRWMCGGEVVAVESLCKRLFVPDINFTAAMLQFDSGATGIMVANWTGGRRVFHVEMHARGISAEADHEGKGRVYIDGDTEGVEYDARQVAGSDELYVYGGFQAKSREFIDCVRSGKQPSSHFGDAVKTMEVAQRILAAALLAEQ